MVRADETRMLASIGIMMPDHGSLEVSLDDGEDDDCSMDGGQDGSMRYCSEALDPGVGQR